MSANFRYIVVLALTTLLGFTLVLGGPLSGWHAMPMYLLWNLFLAWVPFVLTLWLLAVLRRKAWSSWEGLMVSALWLIFLPNTFYMVSDFIHLADVDTGQLLFSAVVYTLFIALGVILGISSLYPVHQALRRRLGPRSAGALVVAILGICSVAIYIGRDLRWNSWDVVADPAGVLFDLSSRLLHPAQYGPMLAVILPFFVLLCSLYGVAWFGMQTVAGPAVYRNKR